MNGVPIVTVLMTAYNREQFIAEAIESVLASTYQDWELIIVDDKSKDDTLAIAQSYAANDGRIKVHTNQQNLGDYPNRNRAVSFATGKYLKFLDSDDRIYPGALQSMVHYIEEFGVEWGLGIYHNTFEIPGPLKLDAGGAYRYHYFNQPIFFATPGEAIFTAKAFREVGGFASERMISDFDMWHKLALNFPMVLMPGKLLWIRTHEGQEVKDRDQYVVKYEKIKLKYLNNKRSPLTEVEVKQIKRKRQSTVLKIFLQKIVRGEFKAALHRFKVFCFYLLH